MYCNSSTNLLTWFHNLEGGSEDLVLRHVLYCVFVCVCVFCRIVQMLGEWCRAETLLRTVSRPFLRREIRSSLTAVTLLSTPELTTSQETLKIISGVCGCAVRLIVVDEAVMMGTFVHQLSFLVFHGENDLALLFSLSHLQREMENQKAQANRFQQQMKKLDEDIKQNEGLLRRTHIEQKTTKVTFLPLTNQYWFLSDPRIVWNDEDCHTFSIENYFKLMDF